MAFMQQDIQRAEYYEVSCNHRETCIVPADLVGNPTSIRDFTDYVNGSIDIDDDIQEQDQIPERQSGYIARLSAPGYMDCTEWSAHKTEEEAREYLAEMYGDDEGDDE